MAVAPKIIISKCLGCGCLYGCNSPRGDGGVQQKKCFDQIPGSQCPDLHQCNYRRVVFPIGNLLKREENHEKRSNLFMVPVESDGIDSAHGYCSRKCLIMQYVFDDRLEKVIKEGFLAGLSAEEFAERISLIRSLKRMLEITSSIPGSDQAQAKEEAYGLGKKLLSGREEK
jgi:hypothetical protein